MKKVKSAQHVAIVQWFIDLGDGPGITRRKLVRGPVRGGGGAAGAGGLYPILLFLAAQMLGLKRKRKKKVTFLL